MHALLMDLESISMCKSVSHTYW